MNKELLDKVNAYINKAENGNALSVFECEDFLNSIPSFTDKHSIEETKEFLDYLGNPDENMKIIHVAGTNGKGSVCNYISSVLIKAGYQVGLFTSPHLVKIT